MAQHYQVQPIPDHPLPKTNRDRPIYLNIYQTHPYYRVGPVRMDVGAVWGIFGPARPVSHLYCKLFVKIGWRSHFLATLLEFGRLFKCIGEVATSLNKLIFLPPTKTRNKTPAIDTGVRNPKNNS